jgi:hypothetical protein
MAARFISCSIDGCNDNAHHDARGSRGLCSRHYGRLLRHGDPLSGRRSPGEALSFLKTVAAHYTGDDCLMWDYHTLANGYGQVRVGAKQALAHRYVCKVVKGPPPTPKHEAAHSCGNGHLGCVNPNHLEWKTRTENAADMVVHGTLALGERHGMAKLTEDAVREIRRLRGVVQQAELANRYGISTRNIREVQSRRTWGWLD